MAKDNWSQEEVYLTIQDYFKMLEKELSGRPYNKAQHNRTLQAKLNGRTKAAIELKHQNISAALCDLGYMFIDGYKPRVNFQRSLVNVVRIEAQRRLIPRQQMTDQAKYPFRIHSWVVYSPNVAVKIMDKSSFLHNGSGIPKGIVSFFSYDPGNDPKPITLLYGDTRFTATLTPDNEDQRNRVRLFWRGDFSKIIAERFRHHLYLFAQGNNLQSAPPEIRFERYLTEADTYRVEFIVPEEVTLDSISYDAENLHDLGLQEGASKLRMTSVYERNLKIRLAAIHIHGIRCLACGFDFGEAYGTWGAGYIEIHHLFPLAAQGEERVVDPATDLIPVCANCHRMFHRKKDRILSLEEVRMMIKGIKE